MILAIDIGGTKTLFGLFENDGDLKKTHKFPTPDKYQDFINQLAIELPKFIGKSHINECVAAVPGKLDRETGVAEALGNRPWTDFAIGPDLSEILGIKVRIENDANLAGLSEALLIPQYRKVAYVTISTGIGGAYVVDGRLDPELIDAEIGQIMLEHEGRLITWEHLASGKSITEHFGMRASDITDKKAWYIIARNIAVGLISVISTTTPDAIIIGGGVGTHLAKFKDKLEEELQIYKPRVVDLPPIFQAKNPEEAVIYGCYALAHQE